jgi:hypothetical protein
MRSRNAMWRRVTNNAYKYGMSQQDRISDFHDHLDTSEVYLEIIYREVAHKYFLCLPRRAHQNISDPRLIRYRYFVPVHLPDVVLDRVIMHG